jgi:hypothetical protein
MKSTLLNSTVVPSVIFDASLGIFGKIFFLPVIISKTFFALEEGS